MTHPSQDSPEYAPHRSRCSRRFGFCAAASLGLPPVSELFACQCTRPNCWRKNFCQGRPTPRLPPCASRYPFGQGHAFVRRPGCPPTPSNATSPQDGQELIRRHDPVHPRYASPPPGGADARFIEVAERTKTTNPVTHHDRLSGIDPHPVTHRRRASEQPQGHRADSRPTPRINHQEGGRTLPATPFFMVWHVPHGNRQRPIEQDSAGWKQGGMFHSQQNPQVKRVT